MSGITALKTKLRIDVPEVKSDTLIKRRYRARHQNRQKCASTFQAAYKRGEIKIPSRCSSCGVECRPEGHHPDYNKPLDVIWLCRDCHLKDHGSLYDCREYSRSTNTTRRDRIDISHKKE